MYNIFIHTEKKCWGTEITFVIEDLQEPCGQQQEQRVSAPTSLQPPPPLLV